MLIKNKFNIIIFTFLLNCCSHYRNDDNKKIAFNAYYYSDSYEQYIIKIPHGLPYKPPLNIANMDICFKNEYAIKETDLLISKSNSLLANSTMHISKSKLKSVKHPLDLYEKILNNKYFFLYNYVSFVTISDESCFNFYNKKNDLILKSNTIADNYEIHYQIKASIRLSSEKLTEAYYYAMLLSKIEIIKIEN